MVLSYSTLVPLILIVSAVAESSAQVKYDQLEAVSQPAETPLVDSQDSNLVSYQSGSRIICSIQSMAEMLTEAASIAVMNMTFNTNTLSQMQPSKTVPDNHIVSIEYTISLLRNSGLESSTPQSTVALSGDPSNVGSPPGTSSSIQKHEFFQRFWDSSSSGGIQSSADSDKNGVGNPGIKATTSLSSPIDSAGRTALQDYNPTEGSAVAIPIEVESTNGYFNTGAVLYMPPLSSSWGFVLVSFAGIVVATALFLEH